MRKNKYSSKIINSSIYICSLIHVNNVKKLNILNAINLEVIKYIN